MAAPTTAAPPIDMHGGAGYGLPSSSSAASSSSSSLPMQQTRHARRLYVGGLEGVPEHEIAAFFNDIIRSAVVRPFPPGTQPVVSVYLNTERKFAFVDLVSIELTNAMLRVPDAGLLYRGRTLKIKRPKDYNAALVPADLVERCEELDLSRLPLAAPLQGGGGMVVGGAAGGLGGAKAPLPGGKGTKDSIYRIFVGNIPVQLGEEGLRDLLTAFGPLLTFTVIRGPDGALKGYAFCEYENSDVTDTVVQALNGLKVGDRSITVSRAKAGTGGGGGGGGAAAGGAAGSFAGGAAPAFRPPSSFSGSNNIPLGAPAYGAAPAPMDPYGAGAGGAAAVYPPAQYGAAGGGGYYPPPPMPPQQQQYQLPPPLPPAPQHHHQQAPSAHQPAAGIPNVLVPQGIPGRVVCLENMVAPEELADDGEYRDIVADITEECSKYGAVEAKVSDWRGH
jgi:hypothetical protein